MDPKLVERINASFEEAKHFYSLLAWRWIRAVQLFFDVSIHSVKLHLGPRGRRLPFSLVIGHVASPCDLCRTVIVLHDEAIYFDCLDCGSLAALTTRGWMDTPFALTSVRVTVHQSFHS